MSLHGRMADGWDWSRFGLALAATLWLIAVFLPATSAGAGSSLSGHVFADLIGEGTFGELAPRWLGRAWYLMPLGGALVLLTLSSDHSLMVASRFVAAIAASGAALVWTGAVADLEPARFGSGSWCAVGGSVLAITTVTAITRHNLRERHVLH